MDSKLSHMPRESFELNILAMERILEPVSRSVFGFFGLRDNPFSISPDPRFLHHTPVTQTALQQLVDGICNRRGLILLTGEVGTGKTLLLHRLLDWLAEQRMPTALIFNSHLNSNHLLDFILSDFGVPCQSSLRSDKLMSLNRWLLDCYRLGQTPVLIIDEAQGLPLHTLEEIRLLLNLETPREKLLQVILAGQPELEEKFKRDELRQLRQRITVRCRTAPLALQETQAYIQEHLRAAGARQPIFQPEAAISVHAYSRGIPRVVNLLCEHSLITARADGSRLVSLWIVERAARDCQLDQVDSVTCVLNSSYAAGAPFGDVGSIFTGMSLSDSARPTSCMDPSVLTEAPAAELHVQPADSGSGEAATVLTKNPAVFAPTLQKADAAQPKRASPTNAIQTRASAIASRRFSRWWRRRALRNRQSRPGFTHATISLFQGWWKSFAADARSTGRQLRRLLRAQVLKVRPYARESR